MPHAAMYPDGLSGRDFCYMEGCIGKGRCSRCGSINYQLMGYHGALARWAKTWRMSEGETEREFIKHDMQNR